ncbi:hypothetical protein RM533_13585, partial [Croceicoccus sp. F390]
GTFRLSSDPLLVDKVQDVVGLCMSPPRRADKRIDTGQRMIACERLLSTGSAVRIDTKPLSSW